MSDSSEYTNVAECLYRSNKSGIYYALVKRAGKQIRRSLKTSDRKLAERKLNDFKRKVERVSANASAKNVTFSELAERWCEISQNGHKPRTDLRRRNSVAQLNRHFGDRPIREISMRDLDSWLVKRASKISASTYNKERDSLNGVFRASPSGWSSPGQSGQATTPPVGQT